MRDFFVYGFKTRTDFQYKSLRTYDNERRRIESWLSDLIKFDSSKKGKQVSISCDSGHIFENPLFKAYTSKSFTSNDIKLHFFLLDILKAEKRLSLNEITDKICNDYGVFLEPQIIRLKLKEYTNQGIIISKKQGRCLMYSLSPDNFNNFLESTSDFSDMASFFSQSSPLGVIGYYILEQLGVKNRTFLAKHNYIVHTLDNNILLSLLDAMDKKKSVTIVNFGKSRTETTFLVVPLRIHISTQTGRRYVLTYLPLQKRFSSFRLDYIKSVKLKETFEKYDFYKQKYLENLHLCWGTSFGNRKTNYNNEQLKMTLNIDEKREGYIVDRLKREGRGGDISKIDNNTYLYTKKLADSSEATPWIKTFIGRIKKFECGNQQVEDRFYNDLKQMHAMYFND